MLFAESGRVKNGTQAAIVIPSDNPNRSTNAMVVEFRKDIELKFKTDSVDAMIECEVEYD